MLLNEIGVEVNECLLSIPEHYKEIELDYYVIMPNHIHVIIILNYLNVETGHAPSLQHKLGNVIGSFKAGITKWANESGFKNFKWQERFYDRIIRNEKELYQIRKYIEQNPLKWEIEKDSPENISLE